MLTAVIIPASATLHTALRTPVARQAIRMGFRLYTNGAHARLMPQALPGWAPMAVVLHDADDRDDQIADEVAA